MSQCDKTVLASPRHNCVTHYHSCDGMVRVKSAWWLLMPWRLAPGHTQPSWWRSLLGVYQECPTQYRQIDRDRYTGIYIDVLIHIPTDTEEIQTCINRQTVWRYRRKAEADCRMGSNRHWVRFMPKGNFIKWVIAVTKLNPFADIKSL